MVQEVTIGIGGSADGTIARHNLGAVLNAWDAYKPGLGSQPSGCAALTFVTTVAKFWERSRPMTGFGRARFELAQEGTGSCSSTMRAGKRCMCQKPLRHRLHSRHHFLRLIILKVGVIGS